MKPLRHLLTASAIALPAAALAQPGAGPYVSIGDGVDLLQNEIVTPTGGPGLSKQAFTFNPGPAADAALGYGLSNGVRIEIAGDYARSQPSSLTISGGAPGRDRGTQTQVGGFLNILYDFALGLPVAPYLGIGAGYQAFDLGHASTSPNSFSLTPEEGAFAYEGVAGLSYQLSFVPGLSLTAEYRMIGVITPPAFPRGAETIFESGVPHVSSATLSNTFNHEALFGLRYAFGTPASPPPAPPPASVAQPPAAPPTRTYLVFFDWDRADLSTRARQIVAEAAAGSLQVQTTRIEVNGYTDLSGSPAYNKRLSIRRAETVQDELVRDGVAQSDIAIRGFGGTNPLLPTAKGVREPENRRVEIILSGGDKALE